MARVEIPVSDTETGSGDEEFAADLALVRSPILLSDFINYAISSVTTPSETEKPVEEVSDCLTKPVDTTAKLPKNARTTLSQSNNPPMDRISSLPDLVLSNILSYLSLETAIQTRILGKKWRNIWLPSREEFVFRQTSQRTDLYLEQITKFICSTMPLNISPKITKFGLKLTSEEHLSKDLFHLVIKCAIERHVKDIVLDLPGHYPNRMSWDPTSILREKLCWYASLETLTLRHIGVDSSLKFCWTSLKALSISSVSVNNWVITEILEACPKLDQLELNECYEFNEINVGSTTCLRKLIIFQCKSRYKHGRKLIISMPKVECSVLKVFERVELRDISSLTDVSIDFYPLELDPYYYSSSRENLYMKHLKSDWLNREERDERVWYNNDRKDRRDILMEFINKVAHIETIRLGPWCVEVASSYVLRCLPTKIPSIKCKCLVLETPVEEWDIPGILALLRSSPCLETLVIDLTTGDNYDSKLFVDTKVAASSANTYWNEQKNIFTKLKHLKNVTIVGLSVRLVDLTKYLLEYAKSLKKLELTKSKTKKNPSLIIEKILRLPRASPNAQILIC